MSKEQLAGLVAKWRGQANVALRRSGTWNGNDVADRIEFMADDLAAILATLPEPGVVSEARKVGCERDDGTLNVHSENVYCSVCAPAAPAGEVVCPHEAWEENGGWCKCVDCGQGWSAMPQPAPAGGVVVCGKCGSPQPEQHRPGCGTQPAPAAQGFDAEVVAAAEAVIGVSDHASFVSGTCCCGDDMELHADPMTCGHSPVDSGSYYGSQAIERLKAALAQQPAAVDGVPAALRDHDNGRAPEFVRCGDGTYRAFKGEGDD